MACGQSAGPRTEQAGLAQALGGCRVFVPLYSATLFQSGTAVPREWSAFSAPACARTRDTLAEQANGPRALGSRSRRRSCGRRHDRSTSSHAGLGRRCARAARLLRDHEALPLPCGVRAGGCLRLAQRIVDAAEAHCRRTRARVDCGFAADRVGAGGRGQRPGSPAPVGGPSDCRRHGGGELPEAAARTTTGPPPRGLGSVPGRGCLPAGARRGPRGGAGARPFGYRPDVGDLDESHGAELLSRRATVRPPGASRRRLRAARQCACRDLLRPDLTRWTSPGLQLLKSPVEPPGGNRPRRRACGDALELALRRKLGGRPGDVVACRPRCPETLEDSSRVLPAP